MTTPGDLPKKSRASRLFGFLARWGKLKLYVRILIGLVLGLVVGFWLGTRRRLA